MRAAGLGLAILVAGSLAGSACASDDEGGGDVASPCKAFAAAPPPRYELEPVANVLDVRHIVSATKAYALDGSGTLHLLGETPSVAIDLGPGVRAVAVSEDGSTLHVLRGASSLEIVRYAGDGATFAPASAQTLALVATGARPDGGALAIDRRGALWIATPDGGGMSAAQDPSSRLGKVLRIENDDVSVFARGFRSPSAIDIDPELGDVWVADTREDGASTEIDRVLEGKSYGWPTLDGLDCFTPAKDCARDGHVPPVASLSSIANGAIVARDERVTPLAGKLVFAGEELGTVEPFGPSGPAATTKLGVNARAVGRGPGGSILVATDAGVSRIAAIAPAAPTSLLATGCFDLSAASGAPAGAIPYEVASPLWSDGADKARFVVIPKGERGRALPDGDLRLPVGTVAVKTFVVDGKKIETRLLVQHELESWVGYSYAWNDAETDAELVVGNRTKALGGDRHWYFPSSADCNACHTPAAGYTLGLEARQIAAGSTAATMLDRTLLAPIDHASHPPLAGTKAKERSVEERARSYLHANCSMCHRDGSATGLAELDLRVDVPLDRTGLCGSPKAGAFGIADARVIAPGAPERSVLLHRMKALDEARMPKLGSHVIDTEAVLVVEEWIRGLAACP